MWFWLSGASEYFLFKKHKGEDKPSPVFIYSQCLKHIRDTVKPKTNKTNARPKTSPKAGQIWMQVNDDSDRRGQNSLNRSNPYHLLRSLQCSLCSLFRVTVFHWLLGKKKIPFIIWFCHCGAIRGFHTAAIEEKGAVWWKTEDVIVWCCRDTWHVWQDCDETLYETMSLSACDFIFTSCLFMCEQQQGSFSSNKSQFIGWRVFHLALIFN